MCVYVQVWCKYYGSCFLLQIVEFITLRDRLTYSLYFIGVLVDMNTLEFVTSANRSVIQLSNPAQ